jgi:hypothetical protein
VEAAAVANAAGSADGMQATPHRQPPSPLPHLLLLAVGAGATPTLLRLPLPHTATAGDGDGPAAGPGRCDCQRRGEGGFAWLVCATFVANLCRNTAAQQRDAIAPPRRASEMHTHHVNGPLAAAVARIRPRARLQQHTGGVQPTNRRCLMQRTVAPLVGTMCIRAMRTHASTRPSPPPLIPHTHGDTDTAMPPARDTRRRRGHKQLHNASPLRSRAALHAGVSLRRGRGDKRLVGRDRVWRSCADEHTHFSRWYRVQAAQGIEPWCLYAPELRLSCSAFCAGGAGFARWTCLRAAWDASAGATPCHTTSRAMGAVWRCDPPHLICGSWMAARSHMWEVRLADRRAATG